MNFTANFTSKQALPISKLCRPEEKKRDKISKTSYNQKKKNRKKKSYSCNDLLQNLENNFPQENDLCGLFTVVTLSQRTKKKKSKHSASFSHLQKEDSQSTFPHKV